ncbi:MAG: SH3 domain-containing protein, partial [Limisphaerales bacterium]
MIATSAVAQNNTNALPPIPAPLTAPAATGVAPRSENAAPAVKSVKHKMRAAVPRKRFVLTEPTVALVPGPAEVAANRVNVRGQAGLKGEVIARVKKGEVVTVLSQMNLKKHRADEPAQWAKIALPPGAHVWVDSQFINPADKTVEPKKLNLRAGPGENYSVIGTIERGTPVTEIAARGKWAEIEPPAGSYAFIAAMYLKQEASGTLAVNPPPSTETEPTPTPVPEPEPIMTQPTNMTRNEFNPPPTAP